MAISVYPPVSSTPWSMQVSRGLISGVSAVNIFASSTNVGTGTPVTLWENTGVTAYAFPATAQLMNMASSSATDTGTAKVLVSGLDANWLPISETITLNGTSNVTTTFLYLRINSLIMVNPATGQTTNVGTITLKNTGGTVTYGQIGIGAGRSFMSVYSVASGFTLYVTNINAYSGGATGAAYVNYRALATNNNVAPANTITALSTTFSGSYQVLRTNPFPYTQKSDVQWQFSVNSGTHAVGLILEAALISNTAA